MKVSVTGNMRKPKKRRARPETQPLERKDCQRFLEDLAKGHPVAVCARKAELLVSWLYALRDEHEEFKPAWEVAYVAGSDFLEDEARRAESMALAVTWWDKGVTAKQADR